MSWLLKILGSQPEATINPEEGYVLPVADYYDLSFEHGAYEEQDWEQRYNELFPNGLTQEEVDEANSVMWRQGGNVA